MDELVTLTEKAIEHIKKLLAEEEEEKPLRLGVSGGGCSGLTYVVKFDEEKERDNVINFDGVVVVLDPKSTIYLKGITMDYDGGLNGKGFTFNNPSASGSCGCGESFSI